MDPSALSRWEPILRSDIAVAFLLLAAVLVLAGIVAAWARSVFQENRELRRELIDHLKSDADITRVLNDFDEVLRLMERHRTPVPPPQLALDESVVSESASGTAVRNAGP